MSETISTLTREVNVWLQNHGYSGDPVEWYTTNYNIAFTDQKTVFVKVTRHNNINPVWLETELCMITHLKNHGFQTVKPYYTELVTLPSNHHMIVLEWNNYEPFTKTHNTPKMGEDIRKLLQQLHEISPPKWLTGSKPYQEAREAYPHREQHATMNNIPSRLIDEYFRLSYLIVGDKQDLEDSTDLVTTHGDLHGKNIMINQAGEPVFVDWESTMLAPPEVDYAKLFITFVGTWGDIESFLRLPDNIPLRTKTLHEFVLLRGLAAVGYAFRFPGQAAIVQQRLLWLKTLYETGTATPGGFPHLKPIM